MLAATPNTTRAPSRTITLGPALEERYAALVAPVVSALERSLSPAVSANRVARIELEPPRIVLRRWRIERRRFGGWLASLAGGYPALLLTDVRRCYPSIRSSTVRDAVDSISGNATYAREIAAFLDGLEARGVTGLPIGPAPSAVLANAVLGTVDRALESAGARHLRWVDDLVIALQAPGDAEGILEVIDAALGAIGLRRHPGKTRVVAGPDGRAEMNMPSMLGG
jgi:reverse transcriptase-like protein